jgi:3-dehydroquinate synthase
MFRVSNTDFKIETRYTNNLSVKSYDKVYDVQINNDDINKIINDNFVEGDYIVADKYFEGQIENTNVYYIEAIEDNKVMDTVLDTLDKLYKNNFTKKNKLIVIGGGIIQDISGFLCGMYKRGIKWVLVPTTMLAMTDSCIGGKVCLNRGGKNMLGLFVSPSKIIISDRFLTTLDHDMIMSGLGESLKLAIIAGREEVDKFIDMYNTKNYVDIIKQSLEIKKTIVEYDELEKNERRVLNYGHTIGHALEGATNYFIPHGIAVLLGMYYINKLFVKTDLFDQINKLILSMVPTKYLVKLDIDILCGFIKTDKKNMGNEICLIVLEDFARSKFIFKNIDTLKSELSELLL